MVGVVDALFCVTLIAVISDAVSVGWSICWSCCGDAGRAGMVGEVVAGDGDDCVGCEDGGHKSAGKHTTTGEICILNDADDEWAFVSAVGVVGAVVAVAFDTEAGEVLAAMTGARQTGQLKVASFQSHWRQQSI